MGADAEDIEEAVFKTTILPLLVKALPYLFSAILGALGGSTVHKVEDADHQAKVENNREMSLDNAAKLEEVKAQLVSYTGTVIHNEEQEREAEIRKLEQRIDRLVWTMRSKGIDVQ